MVAANARPIERNAAAIAVAHAMRPAPVPRGDRAVSDTWQVVAKSSTAGTPVAEITRVWEWS